MILDFQPVPEFSEGQLISASDINIFNQNNTMITRLRSSPQPLFMDSHAYAPKALPLYWRDPYFVIWEGSFIYREGITTANLGFHIKFDGVDTNDGFDFGMSYFGNASASVNIGIMVKYLEFSYLNMYKAAITNPNKYDKFIASAPVYTPVTVTKKSTYTFTMRDGSGNNVSTTDGYLTKNGRVSTISIDLSQLDLQDGELVPIRLLLLVNEDPRKADKADTDNFDPVYSNFNNYFILRPAQPLSPSIVSLNHIFYSHLFANTDGDLSYTDNWNSVKDVTVTGENVLATANLNKLTGKQRYITDRLKNRPMPLTGSILYLSAFGGSSSVKYPQYDVVPGEWEYSKEEYAHAISNTMDEFAVGADNLTKIVYGAGRINPQSNLATFAWNPAFEFYNQPTVSFKYFGNTESRQVMIVDFTEAPASQTSTRSNWLAKGSNSARSGHLFGYFDGGGIATHTGYYGSVYAAHTTAESVLAAGSKKAYKNHFFQVRIPSPNTRVYSPERGTLSTDKDWFFPKGFWEDQVPILFEEKSTDTWGLYTQQTTNTTLQFGFYSEINPSDISSYFTSKAPMVNEFEKQYVKVTGYNNSTWAWKMINNNRGYSQVYINLYDHHSANFRTKANYISYCFLIGMDDYNPADAALTIPTVQTGGSAKTYEQLKTLITSINSRLDENYNNLFVGNPHFSNYNMFWGAPKSTLNMRNIYKDYSDKFFFFTKQRIGNILIVRGKNVNLYYGEIKDLKRAGSPYGSLHKVDDVGVEFEKSESLISGESEQTRIFHLSSIADLAYGQRYYIQGETIIYAAEFFEEPS